MITAPCYPLSFDTFYDYITIILVCLPIHHDNFRSQSSLVFTFADRDHIWDFLYRMPNNTFIRLIKTIKLNKPYAIRFVNFLFAKTYPFFNNYQHQIFIFNSEMFQVGSES